MLTALKVILWIIGIYLLIGVVLYIYTISTSYVTDPKADCLEAKSYDEEFPDEFPFPLNCDALKSTGGKSSLIEKFEANSTPKQAFYEIVEWPNVVMVRLIFSGVICPDQGKLKLCDKNSPVVGF